jgi:serine/threonine protein kinase
LRRLRDLLPEGDFCHAWTNFSFIAPATGHVREVDLLVLVPGNLFLIEIKSLHGRLTSDNGTWVQHRARSGRRLFDNPLFLADQKSKELRSRLTRTVGREQRTVKIPYVQPVIYLSESDLICDLATEDRHWVYGPPGPRSVANTLPSIVDLFADAVSDGHRGEQQAGSLAALVEQAIRPSRRRLMVGRWQLDLHPYEVGPTWQDHHARHETTGAYRRVRIYLYEHAADEDLRRSINAAAVREFEATDGIDHPGILRVDQLEEHEDGPALVIHQPEEAKRLDHYLIEHGPKLDLAARLDLASQLADVVGYAHARGLAHRALSPRAVVVTPPRANSPMPQLQVGEWQFARLTGMSDASAPTTNAAMHIERSAEAYLAPEYQHREGSFAADIFGVGAIAYLLVTGQAPARNREALLDRLAQNGGLRLLQATELPAYLPDLVARATAPAVADRLTDLNEFRTCLSRNARRAESADITRSGTDPWVARRNSRLPDGSTVIKVLGAGSTARALLVSRGKDRAIVKVARSAAAAERLDHEARVLGSLQHPGIIALRRGPYQLGGRTVVEVDLAGDETLRARLNAGDLSADELRRLGGDLFDILTHLEARKIRHRDIKPDNLALRSGPDGISRLVLFDFSLAGASASETSAGTPGYLDPFLGTGSRRHYDAAAERYAAAATLHEMSSGKVPVWGTDGTAARYVDKPTLAVQKFPAAHRDLLTAFFEKALAKETANRFASLHDMHREWTRVFRPRLSPARSEKTRVPEIRRITRNQPQVLRREAERRGIIGWFQDIKGPSSFRSLLASTIAAALTLSGIMYGLHQLGGPRAGSAGAGKGTTKSAVPPPTGSLVFDDNFVNPLVGDWRKSVNNGKSVPVNARSGSLTFGISVGQVVDVWPQQETGDPALSHMAHVRLDVTFGAIPSPSDGGTIAIFCRSNTKGSYGFFITNNGEAVVKYAAGKDHILANVTGSMYLDSTQLIAECDTTANGSVQLRLWNGNQLIISARDANDPIPDGYPVAVRADLADGYGGQAYNVTVKHVAVYSLASP